jgi:hypothetical protein
VLPYRRHRKTHNRIVEYTRYSDQRHSHWPRAAAAPPPHPTPNRVRRRRRRGTEATAISAPTVPRPCVRHGRACAGRPPTISARRRRIESEVGRCAPLQLYTASTTTRTREDQRRSPHPAARKFFRSLAASPPGFPSAYPSGRGTPGPGWWLTYCHEKRPSRGLKQNKPYPLFPVRPVAAPPGKPQRN